jgi:hypothetical protein
MKQHNKQNKKRALFAMLFLIVSVFLSTLSFAQEDNIEYKIKAGYLYNFTKFISWPENESETFNLCIIGKDPFGSIIDPIEKRSVKNKPIRLYRFQSMTEAKHCHLVYFGDSDQQWGNIDFSLSDILTVSSLENTLMTGETKKYIQAGGMFSFFLKKGKVKLHINLQALKKSNLEVSAKLMEIAEIYEGESND